MFISNASLIPVSIVGAHKFYDTLTNFLGLIGYWASAFGAVVLVEHLIVRRGDFSPTTSATGTITADSQLDSQHLVHAYYHVG